jgi:hypothetical protein
MIAMACTRSRCADEIGGATLPGLVEDRLGPLDGRTAQVPAPHGGDEDVAVTPDRALWQAGGAAGVDHVAVVPRTRAELALRRRGREGLFVVYGARSGGIFAAAVLEGYAVAQTRQPLSHGGDPWRELAIVDEGHEIGVVEEVGELVLGVAIVHVDGDGAQLVDREHRLDPLRAVARVDPDVLADSDACGGQVVGEARRPCVELRVASSHVSRDERGAPGHRVGHTFEEVGEVQLHHECEDVELGVYLLRNARIGLLNQRRRRSCRRAGRAGRRRGRG